MRRRAWGGVGAASRVFDDRTQAGRLLGQALEPCRDEHPVVVGLPRGGVPVAYEAAAAIDAPLDVILVRKLGTPGQHELAMGAIGEDGVRVLNEDIISLASVTPAELDREERAQRAELDDRSRRYRQGVPRIPLTGRVVIIVDDGIATGATARAAIGVARVEGASTVVLATPVAARSTVESIRQLADEVVALSTPDDLMAVGNWYRDFSPTTDDDVLRLLRAARPATPGDGTSPASAVHRGVAIPVGDLRLPGELTVPANARGIVAFAHGSGSSRHSPRNRAVAEALNRAGLGTLLFDLLTQEEADERARVFDIPLLATRLGAAATWLRGEPSTASLRVGFFGASTGAGAAMQATADLAPGTVAAVVSRGGRPDLAMDRLAAVSTPTLLIVGSNDQAVLALNRQAAARLAGVHELAVVPGATHLFEEPGTMDVVIELATDWFLRYLG